MKIIHWTVRELADATKERILNHFDSNIAVTGLTGLGKSTFLWQFFHKFKDFKVADKLTYSRSETIELIRDHKLSYCWNDELFSSGNKRRFYDTEQIKLIGILTEYRSNYNIVGGAVPGFFTLDKELIKLFGIHINIISRGIGVIHLPREGRMFNDDIWDVKINKKLEEKWSEKRRKNPDFKIPYHKYTTFAGYVYFKKLNDKSEKRYDELRSLKKGERDNPNKIKDKDQMTFYDKLILQLKLHKLDEESLFQLCEFEGKSLSAVKNSLNLKLRDEKSTKRVKDYLTITTNGTEILKNNFQDKMIPIDDM